MNITSLEIAQATMDMFFCLFCLIMFVSIKANNPKQKSMGMFVRLFYYYEREEGKGCIQQKI